MYYYYRYFEEKPLGGYHEKFFEISEEDVKKITEEEISKLIDDINNSSQLYEAICDLENIRKGYSGITNGVFIGKEEAGTTEISEGQVITKLKDIVVTDTYVEPDRYGKINLYSLEIEPGAVEYTEYFDDSLATKILDEFELRNYSAITEYGNVMLSRVLKYIPKGEVENFLGDMNSSYGIPSCVWRYLSKDIVLDKEFMIEMLGKGYLEEFGLLDSELQKDIDVQKSFIQTAIDEGTYFKFKLIYPILEDDLKETVRQAYIQHINDEKTPDGYNFDGIDGEDIPDDLRNDADFMFELLKKGALTQKISFEAVSSELANNRKFILSVLENTDADVNYDNIGVDIFKDDEVMDKIDLKLSERETINLKVKRLGELEVLEEKIDLLTKETEHLLNKNNRNK